MGVSNRHWDRCGGPVEPGESLRVTKRHDGRALDRLCEDCAVEHEAERAQQQREKKGAA